MGVQLQHKLRLSSLDMVLVGSMKACSKLNAASSRLHQLSINVSKFAIKKRTIMKGVYLANKISRDFRNLFMQKSIKLSCECCLLLVRQNDVFLKNKIIKMFFR